MKASAGTSPFFPPPDSAAAVAGGQEGRLGGCRAAPWDPWDGLGASGRRVSPGPVARGCRGPWGSGGGGVPRGRWPAPAPSASRPAPRRPGGGGGHSSHSSPRPSPAASIKLAAGGSTALWLAPVGRGCLPRCGVTGCGLYDVTSAVRFVGRGDLGFGGVCGGVGMEEGRKCGGRGGTGREGAGREGPESQRWLLAPAPLGQLRPEGLKQLLGLEDRCCGSSLARGRGAREREETVSQGMG